MGEFVLLPTAAAIITAIQDATGGLGSVTFQPLLSVYWLLWEATPAVIGMNGLDSAQPGSIYTIRNVDGKEVTFDEEGFLLDPDLWNERLAEMLALEDGLSELSTIHWHVISFLETILLANGKAPLNSELRKEPD